MAPAAELVGHLGIPVLSSPKPGVKAALSLYRALESAPQVPSDRSPHTWPKARLGSSRRTPKENRTADVAATSGSRLRGSGDSAEAGRASFILAWWVLANMQSDLSEFVELLNPHGVESLVVGGQGLDARAVG
jgi:hypothetical protein